MRSPARLAVALAVLALSFAPAPWAVRPAHAAAEPALADTSWLRAAAYYGKRFGPSILALVGELIEHMGGDGGDPPPPPPPPSGDPPIDDPDFEP